MEIRGCSPRLVLIVSGVLILLLAAAWFLFQPASEAKNHETRLAIERADALQPWNIALGVTWRVVAIGAGMVLLIGLTGATRAMVGLLADKRRTIQPIRIRKMAPSCLADVDPKEIAAAGHAELDALEVEEVWDRAGPFYRHGYVYPGEATYQMMEEVLSPFFFELEKYQQLGMNAQVNKVCMGVLLGLHAFEHESSNEVKGWAPHAVGEWAGEVLSTWNSG